MVQDPLTRVVRLTLAHQHIEDFKQIWIAHKSGIANMQGCLSLQAYQDHKEPHIFFTISRWENEHALDNYRYSDYFKTLWSTVKPMFTAKAMAHSLTPIG
jgi:quinol monooxygenase YgiN